MSMLVWLMALLVLFLVGRVLLKQVGRIALGRVPDTVKLIKVDLPKWRNQALVEAQASPLKFYGFEDIGTYSVSTMPGVLVRILFRAASNLAVHIYDHPRAGSWTEMATRYTDGRSATITDLPATGVHGPSWVRTTYVPHGTATDQMYKRHVDERDKNGIKTLAPQDTIREFEDGYQRYMAWKKTAGMSAEEVAQVAKRSVQVVGK